MKYGFVVYSNQGEGDYFKHSFVEAIKDLSRISLYYDDEYHGVLCVL